MAGLDSRDGKSDLEGKNGKNSFSFVFFYEPGSHVLVSSGRVRIRRPVLCPCFSSDSM